jgi:hypothetical protein
MGVGGEVGALEGALLIEVVVVVVAATVLDVVWGLEQPAVLETSLTTRSDHAPPTS